MLGVSRNKGARPLFLQDLVFIRVAKGRLCGGKSPESGSDGLHAQTPGYPELYDQASTSLAF
jgi:hypothetical protein